MLHFPPAMHPAVALKSSARPSRDFDKAKLVTLEAEAVDKLREQANGGTGFLTCESGLFAVQFGHAILSCISLAGWLAFERGST